jgi:hypothetical protein
MFSVVLRAAHARAAAASSPRSVAGALAAAPAGALPTSPAAAVAAPSPFRAPLRRARTTNVVLVEPLYWKRQQRVPGEELKVHATSERATRWDACRGIASLHDETKTVTSKRKPSRRNENRFPRVETYRRPRVEPKPSSSRRNETVVAMKRNRRPRVETRPSSR